MLGQMTTFSWKQELHSQKHLGDLKHTLGEGQRIWTHTKTGPYVWTEKTLMHSHWLSQLVKMALFLKHALFSQISKLLKSWIFLLSDSKFINTWSFTIYFKKTNACFKVYVRVVVCLNMEAHACQRRVWQWTIFSMNMAKMNNVS